MQPQELYFRGSMAQYWNVIYAEYQRLHAALGHEPFKMTAPNPKTGPIAEYVPKETDSILIAFWDDEHRVVVISVDAEFSRAKEMVWIMAHDQGVDEEHAKSAFSRWQEVINGLEKSGLLVVPFARYQPKKKRGMQLGTETKLKQLREIRLEAIKYKRPIPTKKAAMGQVSITYKTWVAHDKELWAGWDVESYR
jgi:hypothetical protein